LHESGGLPVRYGTGGSVPSGYVGQLVTPLLPKRRRRKGEATAIRKLASAQ
jgi:hypothetical protein